MMLDRTEGADARAHDPDPAPDAIDHAPGHSSGHAPGDSSGHARGHSPDAADDAPDDSLGDVPGARRLPTMRLFVRRLPGARRALELVRLDSWGDTLLGTKLRGELATGYAILLAVCLFEICAWTLLFNYVFQGADVVLSAWTLAAIVLGLLWGIGIFTIDKNLITSDLLRPGAGKYAGAGARIALVLGSAYLTAQPIEHLVFRPVIEERLKQESMRDEALAYARTRAAEVKRKAVERKKPDDDPAVRQQQGNVAKEASVVADLEKASAEADVRFQAAKKEKQRATTSFADRWRVWDRLPHDEPLSKAAADARSSVQRARSALQAANRAFDLASAELETAANRLSAGKVTHGDERKLLTRFEQEALERQRQERQAIEKDEEKQQQFFDQLRNTTYGAYLEREDGRVFTWKTAGALQRAALLAQILEGAPLQWPTNTDPATVSAAEKLCGVSNAVPTEAERSDVFKLWLLILLVAGAIPALSVFYKFTMSRELKLYYSVEDQAAAGNPEAVALWRTHRLRDERAAASRVARRGARAGGRAPAPPAARLP